MPRAVPPHHLQTSRIPTEPDTPHPTSRRARPARGGRHLRPVRRRIRGPLVGVGLVVGVAALSLPGGVAAGFGSAVGDAAAALAIPARSAAPAGARGARSTPMTAVVAADAARAGRSDRASRGGAPRAALPTQSAVGPTPARGPTSPGGATASAATAGAAARARWAAAQARQATAAIAVAAARADRTHVLTRVVRYVLPVPARLGEGFGAVGSHWASRHTGQDFVVPYGTPVHAVGSGRVVRAGWAGPYGNRIELMLPDGTELWFCHLSRFAVRSGPVTVGQVIGYVGATGNATGPHLHFEVHPPAGSALAATSPSWAYPVDEPGVGRAVNPIPWLRARGLL